MPSSLSSRILTGAKTQSLGQRAGAQTPKIQDTHRVDFCKGANATGSDNIPNDDILVMKSTYLQETGLEGRLEGVGLCFFLQVLQGCNLSFQNSGVEDETRVGIVANANVDHDDLALPFRRFPSSASPGHSLPSLTSSCRPNLTTTTCVFTQELALKNRNDFLLRGLGNIRVERVEYLKSLLPQSPLELGGEGTCW